MYGCAVDWSSPSPYASAWAVEHQLAQLGGAQGARARGGRTPRSRTGTGSGCRRRPGSCRRGRRRAGRGRFGAVEAGEAGFDDERLAEDAGGLGERHREPASAARCGRPAWCCGRRGRARGRWSGPSRPSPTSSAARASGRRRTTCRTRRRSCRRGARHRSTRSSRARSTSPPSVVAVRRRTPGGPSRCPRPTTPIDAARGAAVRRGPTRAGRRRGCPCSAALARIQRRKSGSAAVTADCIASKVGRLTLLANSEASRGDVPVATAVERDRLTLDGVERGGDRGPRPSARRAARRRRRPGGPPGRGRWRARGRPASAGVSCAVGELDLGRELRGDVGVQPSPGAGTGGRQLGVRGPPRTRSSGGRRARPGGGAAAMVGDLGADVGEFVDAERGDPVGEPGEQRAQRGVELPSLADSGWARSSRESVATVA